MKNLILACIVCLLIVEVVATNEIAAVMTLTATGSPTHISCFQHLNRSLDSMFYVTHDWQTLKHGMSGRALVSDNMRLHITDTQPQDQGLYTCHLYQDGERHTQHYHLVVYTLAYYYKRVVLDYQVSQCTDDIAYHRTMEVMLAACPNPKAECLLDSRAECDPPTGLHDPMVTGYLPYYSKHMNHADHGINGHTPESDKQDDKQEHAHIQSRPQSDISFVDLNGVIGEQKNETHALTHRLVIVIRQKLPPHFSSVNFSVTLETHSHHLAAMTTESTGSEQGTMGMEMPSDVERAGKQSERVSVKASDNQSEPVAMRTSFVQSEPVGVNASDNQVASVDLNHQSEAENENSATFSPSEYEALNVPVQEKTGSGTDDHAKNNETDIASVINKSAALSGPLVKREASAQPHMANASTHPLMASVSTHPLMASVSAAANLSAVVDRTDIVTVKHLPHCDKHSLACIEQNLYFILQQGQVSDFKYAEVHLQHVNSSGTQLQAFEDDVNLICGDGYVPYRLICLACKPGTVSISSSQKCEPCAKNTYQDKYASTKCHSCPMGIGTSATGAVSNKHCNVTLLFTVAKAHSMNPIVVAMIIITVLLLLVCMAGLAFVIYMLYTRRRTQNAGVENGSVHRSKHSSVVTKAEVFNTPQDHPESVCSGLSQASIRSLRSGRRDPSVVGPAMDPLERVSLLHHGEPQQIQW